jgi:hypothetical protein
MTPITRLLLKKLLELISLKVDKLGRVLGMLTAH